MHFNHINPIDQNSGVLPDKLFRIIKDYQSYYSDTSIMRHAFRHTIVAKLLCSYNPLTVLDVGCGNAYLLRALKLAGWRGQRYTGIDNAVSHKEEKNHIITEPKTEFIFADFCDYIPAIKTYDASVAVEVIEHLRANKLNIFKNFLFNTVQSNLIIISTPNRMFIETNKNKHADHKFEFSSDEFSAFCNLICSDYSFKADKISIGYKENPYTFIAVFTKQL